MKETVKIYNLICSLIRHYVLLPKVLLNIQTKDQIKTLDCYLLPMKQ